MKTSEETKANSLLVRTIEAAVGVAFPDPTEQQFRDSACRAGLAALPNLDIGHVVRLHEALCHVEHASPAEKELRAGLMSALGRHHNLRLSPAGRAEGREVKRRGRNFERDAALQLAALGNEEAYKPAAFAEIVRLRAAAHAAQYAPPETDTDAIEDLQEHLGMLKDNDLDDAAPRVMLENLAELTASAERLRDRLLGQMTREEVTALHTEVARG